MPSSRCLLYAALALLAFPLASASGGRRELLQSSVPGYTVLTNTAVQGSNLAKISYPAVRSFEECAEYCDNDRACAAFSFNAASSCFLKPVGTSTSISDTNTAGMKTSYAYQYLPKETGCDGASLATIKGTSSVYLTVYRCERYCDANFLCLSFTHASDGSGTCYLKSDDCNSRTSNKPTNTSAKKLSLAPTGTVAIITFQADQVHTEALLNVNPMNVYYA